MRVIAPFLLPPSAEGPTPIFFGKRGDRETLKNAEIRYPGRGGAISEGFYGILYTLWETGRIFRVHSFSPPNFSGLVRLRYRRPQQRNVASS